jgi:hypothetical protein
MWYWVMKAEDYCGYREGDRDAKLILLLQQAKVRFVPICVAQFELDLGTGSIHTRFELKPEGHFFGSGGHERGETQ